MLLEEDVFTILRHPLSFRCNVSHNVINYMLYLPTSFGYFLDNPQSLLYSLKYLVSMTQDYLHCLWTNKTMLRRRFFSTTIVKTLNSITIKAGFILPSFTRKPTHGWQRLWYFQQKIKASTTRYIKKGIFIEKIIKLCDKN